MSPRVFGQVLFICGWLVTLLSIPVSCAGDYLAQTGHGAQVPGFFHILTFFAFGPGLIWIGRRLR